MLDKRVALVDGKRECGCQVGVTPGHTPLDAEVYTVVARQHPYNDSYGQYDESCADGDVAPRETALETEVDHLLLKLIMGLMGLMGLIGLMGAAAKSAAETAAEKAAIMVILLIC